MKSERLRLGRSCGGKEYGELDGKLRRLPLERGDIVVEICVVYFCLLL